MRSYRYAASTSAVQERGPWSRLALGLVLSALPFLGPVGCGGNVTKAVPGGPPPADYNYLTGNWVFTATPDAGATPPFTSMSGFINEITETPNTYDPVTAVLQIQPASSCFAGLPTIPLSGSVGRTTLKLSSFSVNGQFISLAATKNGEATSLQGTYKASSGCVKGSTGTFSGVRYSPLTGTFAGSLSGQSPAPTVSLNLTQMSQGTGDGTFLAFGYGAFTGFPCFSKGTLLAPSGIILGNTLSLTFVTNDATKAEVVVTGQFDQAASSISVTNFAVSSGSCSGSYGSATLDRQ